MKRTFGKILSFALVLAMLLAMVPAVLAATTESLYLAPGETKTLSCENAKYWRSSNDSVVRVAGGSDGSATITAVASSSSYYGNSATISAYAYEKESDYNAANPSDRKEALKTWNVTVTNWAITLSTTTSGGYNSGYGYGYGSSTGAALESGASLTLKATVTGPKGRAGEVLVGFASEFSNVATVDGKEAAIGSYYVNNSGNGESTVKVAAVDGGTGPSVITAYLLREVSKGGDWPESASKKQYKMVTDANGDPITKTFTVTVGGQAGYDLTLPDAQQDLTIVYSAALTKLTPTLKRYGQTVSNKTFVYESSDTGKITVASDGTIYPQVKPKANETIGPVNVTVSVNGMPSVSATCKVRVVASTANGLTIDYDDQDQKFAIENGEAVFAYKDTTANTTSNVLGSLKLKVTVISANSADKNRVKWTSSDARIANFNNEATTTGATPTLTAASTGRVTVTAEIDGQKSNTLEFYVWQGREYKEVVTTPDIPNPISSREDAFNSFSEQLVTVRLTNVNRTVSLPLKDVQFISNTNNKIQLQGTIDGIDTQNKIVYYPRSSNLKTIKSSEAKLSDITIITQPQDATYKLNATVGTLSIMASVSGDKKLTNFTWYDNNDKAVKSENVSGNKNTYTSTLNLADFIQSAGSHGFYCIVKDSTNTTVKSRTALVTIGGDYNVKITPSASSVKPGDTVTLNAVPQQYNPARKTYTDVTGKTYTVSWTVTEGSDVVTLNSRTGSSVTLTAKSGGTATITAETTIDGNKYTGTQKITVTVPTAEDVQLMLEEDASYVMLDGGKLSDAVKKATSTTPSTFSFTLPTTGTIYSSSSLSSSISAGNKYSASDVSRMAFKPSRSAGSYTIDYAAYGTSGQIATGKLVIMTNAGTVAYHISANESQTMQVSDFQSVYGSGLSYVRFGTASDSRGALYKGSSTSSGKVGSESYYVSTGTTLLKNVTFIAGSSTAKYSVVIPFTAYGSNGEANGDLVIYVNDTHSVYSTGATFKSMAIADELAPESNASSAYITITRVTGGKLYTQYSKINSCTALAAKDLGSTRFSFSGSNSIDNLYVLPLADSKTVEVNYTINGSDKGTLTFKVVQQTASSKFTDVSGSFKWAANSVDFMYGNGLVNGISTKNPNVFGPGQNMTRAMLVTILYRAAGEPSVAGITNKFTDNKQNQYYYEPVLWASSKGIVNGATATTFDPDGKITREQIAAILYRYAGSPAASSSALNGFADQSAVSSYAVTAMQWAVGNGIITGVSTNGRTTLSAKNNATRAQVSVMLHRFLTMEQ